MKRVNLNGMWFEVYKSKMYPVAPITGANRDEIFEVYVRPSNIKVSIWHDWCDWCDAMNRDGYKCGIQIALHNGFAFTITGSIRTENETWDLWITRDHNRLYRYSD